MDPYDVLGVSHSSDWKTVKKAYKKMLVQTHPDKMGNAKYFMMVHEAFASLKENYENMNKECMYPKQNKDYSSDVGNVKMQKPKEQFNINRFNQMFEEYAKLYNETDPHTKGYKTNKSLNYQEDIDQLKKQQIKIPKRQLVIFKEPEALVSSSLTDNVYNLGVNEINDYTCKHGTDYMRAYSEDAELIDNRKEFRNIDEIQQFRRQQRFEMTNDEIKKAEKNKRKQEKLEKIRQNTLRNNDNKYKNIYNYMNNKLL